MTATALPSTISRSSSELADFIAKQREDSIELLLGSTTFGRIANDIHQELDGVFQECSSSGWDGAGAKPISVETLRSAKTFLDSFPLGIEPPDVGAEPDGAITLEWYRSPGRIVSISINPGSHLHFAAIIGAKKRHGADYARNTISEDLLELIWEVTGKTK